MFLACSFVKTYKSVVRINEGAIRFKLNIAYRYTRIVDCPFTYYGILQILDYAGIIFITGYG
jgi:hypothetical protein